MTVLESTTRAYRLNGNAISEASMEAVLNAAYAMLASNDEVVPPFDDWNVEEVSEEGDRVLSYYTSTETGKEIRLSFSYVEQVARIMLLSGDEECFIGDRLFCTINSPERYRLEEWL